MLEVLVGEIDNPAWWAQATAVAYEQCIGRRIPGQRPDVTFQASASKSTSFGMQVLMDKWEAFVANDPEELDLIEGEVRVSGTENRITWRTKAKDDSSLIVLSEPKTNGTAFLVAQQMGLRSLELNNEAKAKWQGILTAIRVGLTVYHAALGYWWLALPGGVWLYYYLSLTADRIAHRTLGSTYLQIRLSAFLAPRFFQTLSLVEDHPNVDVILVDPASSTRVGRRSGLIYT